MRRNDETDYLIRYTTTTFSSASSYYQVSTIVGIELGSEDGKGQRGLCIGDFRRHGGREIEFALLDEHPRAENIQEIGKGAYTRRGR